MLPVLVKPSSFTSINMRAIVLLCLLHAASGQYFWNSPDSTTSYPEHDVCLLDQTSCGCCLMQKQMHRMVKFFNLTHKLMSAGLRKSKMALDTVKASRSVFSVGLNDHKNMSCYGPFSTAQIITYKHVFINWHNVYSTDTGIFTVRSSGVYSIAVTIYTPRSAGTITGACAYLQLNGMDVAVLFEQENHDLQDSFTVVVTLELRAGDQMAVLLTARCFICDNTSRFNTFTGFLLYATDSYGKK
ncbi:uncharacterized protein LOC144462873 [Epinephelus lanceolatus]